MNIPHLKANQPIGIFDSGVGGLTVAHAIRQLMPKERIIYFGDTAHLPYGDKAASSIQNYTKVITEFLISQNCKAVVVACNTASSIAGNEFKAITENKALALNVIDPVVEVVASNKKYNDIGVIGTKGTIKSGVYERKLKAISPRLNVHSLATPLFVPVIEEMLTGTKISTEVIREYLSKDVLKEIDILILGCTHYPLIKEEITNYYEGTTEVIDAAELVANRLKQLLESANLLNNTKEPVQHQFYVSDYTDSFENSAHAFFGREIHLEEKNIWT